jgi:predicted house-cleaning noncanonical NTP pyrophosphatase (MazG superfamily)
MATFIFNKLVRDNIVRLHEDEGTTVNHVTLNDEEYVESLIEKLREETQEIATASPEEILAELADVQQVLDDLTIALGHTKEERSQKQEQKKAVAGGFSARSFIRTITLDRLSPWLKYYTARPNQYPEVK